MEVDAEGDDSLVTLCQTGSVEQATELLSRASSAEQKQLLLQRGEEALTPLLAACRSGSSALVDLLLRAGADDQAVDEEGRGAALLAAESGNLELLSALVSSGRSNCTEISEDGSTLLLCAAAGGNPEMIGWILDGPPGAAVQASLEERDSRGADALLIAAENGAVPAVKELLRRGASSATVDSSGCGIFHYAAAGGHLPMVDFCVKQLKLPCNVQDADGDTPLLIAAHEGHLSVVEWLLKHGSSLAERNHEGMSVLLAAAAGERSEVLEYLSKRAQGGEELWAAEAAAHPELVLNFLEHFSATMKD